ncbi:MAG: UpxY family transcription antiterminator [Chitinophagaceae bacterium]|nr:UpxY family transcription antiterminator [Chitinophagaceae bacterium]
MQRNWYVICTQKRKEKKVATMLTKKGIENFCPLAIKEIKNVSRNSREYGPLFNSYVFIHVLESDVAMIKNLPNVINTLYWRSQPAIINPDEINAIKMMVENYTCMQLEKKAVIIGENIGIVERSITGISNNVTSIKHQGITVTLPTLGYSITAAREKARASPVTKPKESLTVALVKRLNPLFLFGY